MDCKSIHGVLLLDKPQGITSNLALQKAKRLFQAKKAGHTGSLDPLATGLLPICFGEATKFTQFLLDSDKHYQVTAKFGIKTITGDSEGEIISERPVNFSETQLLDALEQFRGDIQQIPPMYSALKHQGQPLYKLARQGVTIEREPRRVSIFELTLLDWQGQQIKLEVRVSKGTYIRSLVEDLGEVLGCGAHVTELRRLGAGPYHYQQMHTFEVLEQAAVDSQALSRYLLPVASAVTGIPEIRLASESAVHVRQGQAVQVLDAPTSGLVRLTDQNMGFLGIGEILEDGRVAPRRLTQEIVPL